MNTIEVAVDNPKTSVILLFALLLPALWVKRLTVALRNVTDMEVLFFLIVAGIIGCLIFACCLLEWFYFSLKGKYIVEFNVEIIRIRRIGIIKTCSPDFKWSRIKDVGYYNPQFPTSRNEMFIETLDRLYGFGPTINKKAQIKLAEDLRSLLATYKKR